MRGSRVLTFLFVVMSAALLGRYGMLRSSNDEVFEYGDGPISPAMVQVIVPPVDALPHPAPAVDPGVLLDLQNIECPVVGGQVDGVTFVEWNGIRVGVCCTGCIDQFAGSPEQFLADANLDWTTEAEMIRRIKESDGQDREKLLREAKERFTVIRVPRSE